MEFDAFPSCCGALIVHDFYGKLSQADMASLKDYKKEYAIIVAILTENQKLAGKDLIELGFKRSGPVRNPNSGNNLYTYLYEKRRKKRVRK